MVYKRLLIVEYSRGWIFVEYCEAARSAGTLALDKTQSDESVLSRRKGGII
jgi:hypothetical protein